MVGCFFFILFVCFSFCLHIQYINSFVKCIICDDELKRLIRITVAAPLFRIISVNRIFCSDFSIFLFSKWNNRHFLIFFVFWHFFSFWISFFDIFSRFEHKKTQKIYSTFENEEARKLFLRNLWSLMFHKKIVLFVKLITLCQTIWVCVCDWIKMLTAILAINEFKLISNYILKLFYMQLRCNTTLNTMYDIT